jgi:hypothetical protein
MTTNRELFDTVVAEVERDYAHVFEHEEGAVPSEDEEGFVQYEVFEALPLGVPTEVFSNFAVRDALMAKANGDDKFTFVLCNKIIHHAKEASDAGNFGQSDLDALATAIHMQVMWEQAERAVMLGSMAIELAKEGELKMPSIMDASRKLLMAQQMMGVDIAEMRIKMGKELTPILMQALDE